MIFFRIFGVISLVITLIFLLLTVASGGLNGTGIWFVLWSAAWTALWFWLASRSARRQRERLHAALMGPCTQCGADASSGYRICGSCGRVKDPVLL